MHYLKILLIIIAVIFVPNITQSEPVQLEIDSIHLASQNGNLREVKRLLAANPSLINIDGNRRGWCPIDWASSVAVAKYLLENGAILNPEPKKGPNEPDSIWSPLQAAANNGKTQVAEYLLLNGAIVDWKGVNERTALSFSSEKGHQETAALLLSHRADPNLGDDAKFTPLHYATLKNHKNIIALLLQHGADIILATVRN